MDKLDKPLDALIKENAAANRPARKPKAANEGAAKKKPESGKKSGKNNSNKKSGDTGKATRARGSRGGGRNRSDPIAKPANNQQRGGSRAKAANNNNNSSSSSRSSRGDGNRASNNNTRGQQRDQQSLSGLTTACKVNIDNLDPSIVREDVVELLNHFNLNKEVQRTSVNRGRATVVFNSRGSASKAIDALNGRELDGRPMSAAIVGSSIVVNRKAGDRGGVPAKYGKGSEWGRERNDNRRNDDRAPQRNDNRNNSRAQRGGRNDNSRSSGQGGARRR